MTCEVIQDHLSDYLDGLAMDVPRSALDAHLAACPSCAQHLAELETVVGLLRARQAPPAPPDLMDRIRLRLDAEPAPAPARTLFARLAGRVNWPSVLVGAVAAAVMVVAGVRLTQFAQPLPTIQTAAVGVATPASVNIGFDVAHDVQDVTFTIDLPKGLEFVDAHNQPVTAQSVSWQGSLKRGKTVVPITVRGVQPGRYEILATVRKDQFAQRTKIVLPVDGKQGLAPVHSEV